MSKKFKPQDYFRYKKLGKRWRRPVGLQSKLRLGKGGSGMKPAIGYGTHAKQQPVLVKNIRDFEKDCSSGVIISSTVGSKRTVVLAAKAKELGLTIMNMKKVKRAMRIDAEIKKKAMQAKKKEEKEVKEEKKTSAKTEKKAEEKTEKKTKEKKKEIKDESRPEIREDKVGQ